MQQAPKWNAWQVPKNGSMRYSLGEGFTERQKNTVRQAFRKLTQLTAVTFAESRHHDMFTSQEAEKEWPGISRQYPEADSFHMHDMHMEGKHSDIHIVMDDNMDFSFGGVAGMPFSSPLSPSGDSQGRVADTAGKDSNIIRINAKRFLNDSDPKVFLDTLHHELAHAVAGFAHSEEDNRRIEEFVQELRSIGGNEREALSGYGNTRKFLSSESVPGDAGIRSGRSRTHSKRSTEEKIAFPDVQPDPAEKQTFTYTVHNNGMQLSDRSKRTLDGMLGSHAFRETESGEKISTDVTIVYFDARQCRSAEPVVYDNCKEKHYLWIDNRISSADLQQHLEQVLPYIKEKASLPDIEIADGRMQDDVSSLTRNDYQWRRAAPPVQKHPSGSYHNRQSFAWNNRLTHQNSPVIHRVQQDMNGDGRPDLLQFTRNNSYQVALRQANGTFGPVMSERQWEEQIKRYSAGNYDASGFTGAGTHQPSPWQSGTYGYSHQGGGVNNDVAVMSDYMTMPALTAGFSPASVYGSPPYAVDSWQPYAIANTGYYSW